MNHTKYAQLLDSIARIRVVNDVQKENLKELMESFGVDERKLKISSKRPNLELILYQKSAIAAYLNMLGSFFQDVENLVSADAVEKK